LGDEHEPRYPMGLVEMAGRAKATLQMLVGVYALGWLVWAFLLSPHMHNCAAISQHPAATGPQFCYYIPPARVAFQIIADALGAATVIRLVYTLFTPGPDEALDPVLLAIATALLFQLGSVESFRWQDGLAVLLYGAALSVPFAVRIFIAPDRISRRSFGGGSRGIPMTRHWLRHSLRPLTLPAGNRSPRLTQDAL
jgi:hypothetical protein